jgi:hypothetical protein
VASWRKYVDVVDNSEKVSKNIGLFPQIGGGAEGGEMDFTSPPTIIIPAITSLNLPDSGIERRVDLDRIALQGAITHRAKQ